jgi:hypothetical protein
MNDKLNAAWLDIGGFKVGSARPTLTSRIRDHLQEVSGRTLRLVKMDSYGYSSGYYLREGDGSGEPQVQYVMAIDPRLPSLVLGLSIEKGEEVARAPSGRRMNRRTWDWPAIVALRPAAFEAAVTDAARRVKRPLTIVMWTDREDEEWHYTFASGRWLQRGVPSSARHVVDRLHHLDEMRSRWCDVWIGSELGREDMGRTTVRQAAGLLHAFSPLRDRLRRRAPDPF